MNEQTLCMETVKRVRGMKEGNRIAPKSCSGGGPMEELESSLHLSMTFQPFAVLATKKDAVSMMIYTNNQTPKLTVFFSPFHVLPLSQPPYAGAITALVKKML